MVGAICQPMQVAAGAVAPNGLPGGAKSMERSSESSALFTTSPIAARPTRSLSPGELARAGGRELSGPQPELSLPATVTASGARSVSGMKSARSKLFKMQLAATLPADVNVDENDVCKRFLQAFLPVVNATLFPEAAQ